MAYRRANQPEPPSLEMLGLFPQDFNAVQLGARRREVEQAQPLSRRPPTAVFDASRVMDARIVECHDVRLRTDLRAELIENGDPFSCRVGRSSALHHKV